MEEIKVSIFASSVRRNLYEQFFKALEGTSVEYEVVFAGNNKYGSNLLGEEEYYEHNINGNTFTFNKDIFKYIETENIKPAQCYEIARRACKGEVVIWAADDCQFSNDVVGKAYHFWKAQKNEKLVLSLLTKERYNEKFFLTRLEDHKLRGPNTPLMAPIGMMSREYLERLGGADRRYICGQYENDFVMRVLEDGGEIGKFEDAAVIIDHFNAHAGVSNTEGDKRPFAQGYPNDRRVLEGSWIKNGCVPGYRLDKLEKYEDTDILTKSQSNNLPGMWV